MSAPHSEIAQSYGLPNMVQAVIYPACDTIIIDFDSAQNTI